MRVSKADPRYYYPLFNVRRKRGISCPGAVGVTTWQPGEQRLGSANRLVIF